LSASQKSTMRTRIPFALVDIIEALFMLFNLQVHQKLATAEYQESCLHDILRANRGS
jgi:hypothetical protein